ncbi:unnamed protein product [Mesocestoides corti]|uniref:Spindle pole body component 29 n=1 Tax=Mesocestoides corti TaxID=53468 RepID=A0A0R3U1R3_MESCO|nr:unnamed protein product [Mesocestoides corti]
MTETDESVPLKDRYESLKILCSEQILANELLKDELDRLRKSFREISRHRTFLLEKLVSQQSKSATKFDHESNRINKVSSAQHQQNRSSHPQRSRILQSDRRTSVQVAGVHSREGLTVDESDPESESLHEDFDNGWGEDFHDVDTSSYRRPQLRNLKRQPKLAPSPHPPLSLHNKTSFKRPRMIVDAPGPSSRGDYVDYNSPGPSHSPGGGARTLSYEVASNGDDLSEEPPLIYSKGVGFPLSNVTRRNNSGIIRTSPVVGGNGSDRTFSQKPPTVGGGYIGPRLHR